MENGIYYGLRLLVIFATIAIQFGYSAPVTAIFECSNPNLCHANDQISFSNEEILQVATSSSCGICTLKLNATRGHQVHLEIESVSSWSQLYHFYFVYVGTTTGFAEKPEKCGITFPTNSLEVGYKMDATFVIRTQVMNPGEQCSESDVSTCNPLHNCKNLLSFYDLKKVTYQEQESVLESAFNHPIVYKLYGETEIRGALPLCATNCVCSLHYHRLVAHCDGETKQTLLLHPDLVPLNIFSVIFSGNRYDHDPLTVLDASNRQLECIDANAFQDFRYVNRLVLNQNLLTRISTRTFNWNGLLILELADNKLTELEPDVFNSLTFLLLLDLHGNQLTNLHPDLFKSQQLLFQAMDLSKNNLTELLPETFSPLEQMGTLILDQNSIAALQKGTFKDMKKLQWLFLNDNQLTSIEPGTFSGLEILYRLQLSGNQLTAIESDMFQGAETLRELELSRNSITNLPPDVFQSIPAVLAIRLDNNQFNQIDLQSFKGLEHLLGLNISGNHLTLVNHGLPERIKVHSSNETSLFPRLRLLLLNNNQIQDIDGNVFKEMPEIESIQIRGNPLKRVDKKTFQSLKNNNTNVLVDEPATCCFIDKAQCKAQNQREPYLTCLRLLPNLSVRVFMWIFGLFAFVGNLSVLLWRCVRQGRENIIQVLLIENLAASDLLMGVYMLMIASADAYYQQYFPSESDGWRNGPLCKLAGALSVLSSEASVFFITLISIDRFLAIKYPRGKQRLTKCSARITLICLWSLALLLSIIPTSVGGKSPDFYDASEVCIGLPFVRAPVFVNRSVVVADFQFEIDDLYSLLSSGRDDVYYEDYIYPVTGNKPGLYFSIILFLGINLLCFFVVAVSYVAIFIIVKQTSKSAGKSRRDQEITLAIRMGAIVITDFMCWVPIVVLGILVQSATITISPVVYVYIVVFVLPINSAVNPYIYTIAILISDYRTRARAKTDRNKKVKTKATVSSKNSQNNASNSQLTSFSNQRSATESNSQAQIS